MWGSSGFFAQVRAQNDTFKLGGGREILARMSEKQIPPLRCGMTNNSKSRSLGFARDDNKKGRSRSFAALRVTNIRLKMANAALGMTHCKQEKT
jgi:hypothetical protein